MITSFNTPVRELDGHIFVAVEELYKKDEKIEDLKNQLRQEKDAYNRMYNMYVEKDNIINELEEYLQNEISEGRSEDNVWLMGCYDEDREILNKLQELKGSDK